MSNEIKQFMTESEVFIRTIRGNCEEFKILTLNRHIDACEKLVTDTDIIDVAVLGQFKAGKSSFLNTLLGETVLPVGAIPVTTVITRISGPASGDADRAVVTFDNGNKADVPLPELELYITEKNNPGNTKGVHFVDIELKSMNSFKGLRFVDTPGLGSVFKNHGETSENWLPSAGTAIIAVSADRPLSESDLSLIREVSLYTPKIVILLTKCDIIDVQNRGEVTEYMKTVMLRELGTAYPVYLYSAKHDTAGYREIINRDILLPLSSGHEEIFNSIFKHKLLSLGRLCTAYLEIALASSRKSDEERSRVKELILNEKLSYDLIRNELNMTAREYSLQTRGIIKSYLDSNHREALTVRMMKDLENEMASWKGNLAKFTREYEKWLKEKLTDEMYSVSGSDYKKFFGSLESARAAIQRSVSLFTGMLNHNIEKTLGISFPENEFYLDIEQPEYPDIKISRSFDSHLDMYWFIIPMFIFRKAFERYFVKQIPWAVQMNLSRLAYQWEKSINKAIDSIKEQALQHIKNEIETVDKLIYQDREATVLLESRIKKLKDMMIFSDYYFIIKRGKATDHGT